MVKLQNKEQAEALRTALTDAEPPVEIATQTLAGRIVISFPEANRVLYIEPDGRIKGMGSGAR